MKSFGQLVRSRKMLYIFFLGFASGLPIALTRGTLQAWLTESNVNIESIGLFSLVGTAYTLKFLWSPLMDRFSLPFLGRRRGWIVLCQLLLMASIFFLGQLNPATQIELVALLAVVIAFFSASQDIVVDAYRTELLEKDELGTGAGLSITSYRIAMIFSGSIALILADHLPWSTVYAIMAASLLLGVLAALRAPEPDVHIERPKTIQDAVIQPLFEYFRRKGALEILLFVVLYKLGDVLAAALQTKFLLSLGFSKSDIGYISKGFGLAMTILGSLAGGAMLDKLGMKRALIIFGILQGVSNLSFAWLAHAGQNYWVMSVALTFENLCSGLGNAAYIAFLMGLCNKKFSATQYALLTSLGAVPPVFLSASTGFMVAEMGWVNFFYYCTLAAIPGILMIAARYDVWTRDPLAA